MKLLKYLLEIQPMPLIALIRISRISPSVLRAHRVASKWWRYSHQSHSLCRQKNPAPPEHSFTLEKPYSCALSLSPHFCSWKLGCPTLPNLLAQMVETRGNRPSLDGTAELPSFSVDDGDIGELFPLGFLLRCLPPSANLRLGL